MSTLQPMLASPLSKANVTRWSDWVVEEKYDGVRLIVHIGEGTVRAFTRPRKHAGGAGKSMATRELPSHLRQAMLDVLPVGIYDGELLGGATSTDVVRTDLQHTLSFVVFDLLEWQGRATWSEPYAIRRQALTTIWDVLDLGNHPHLKLAEAVPLREEADLTAFLEKVWRRGGEGGIMKRRDAPYRPGKRSPDFIKLKKLGTAVITVTGFDRSRGEVMDRGPYAIVCGVDENGIETRVKTKDDAALADLEAAARGCTTHPFIGRKLRIEYQDYTPKGGYRHPRWDRWEDE